MGANISLTARATHIPAKQPVIERTTLATA
jgi:hypothetical protein